MDDLISRSAAIEALDQHSYENGSDYDKTVELLNELPAVDAVPVVHARWRWTNGHYECTACGGNRFHDLALGCDASYCPRCGARMDGEEHA